MRELWGLISPHLLSTLKMKNTWWKLIVTTRLFFPTKPACSSSRAFFPLHFNHRTAPIYKQIRPKRKLVLYCRKSLLLFTFLQMIICQKSCCSLEKLLRQHLYPRFPHSPIQDHHSVVSVLYSSHPFRNKVANRANLFHHVCYLPRETMCAPMTVADSWNGTRSAGLEKCLRSRFTTVISQMSHSPSSHCLDQFASIWSPGYCMPHR